jgi:hypothetical protein
MEDRMNELLTEKERLILPSDEHLLYTGRIDDSNPDRPCFVYAGTSVTFRFVGTKVKLLINNRHNCYVNFIGYVLDKIPRSKVEITEHGTDTVITLVEGLEKKEHEIVIYKCQDAAHFFDLVGIIVEEETILLDPPARPKRRMEVFGDSVSCGEVSECVEYVGISDPENHNGIYSNSWYSYAFIAARKLEAELHCSSQGGLALLDETGWFHGPDYVGLLTTYNKIKYNTQIEPYTEWDFNRYTPHVVLVAIGQNDANPENYMGIDEVKSAYWKDQYEGFLKTFRGIYPNALFVLTTTILNHEKTWDEAIEEVCNRMNDPKIVHFLYTKNGCGTHGHIRIPEAEKMAEELTAFIDSFGAEIWN